VENTTASLALPWDRVVFVMIARRKMRRGLNLSARSNHGRQKRPKEGVDPRKHGGRQRRRKGNELDGGPKTTYALQQPTELVGGRM